MDTFVPQTARTMIASLWKDSMLTSATDAATKLPMAHNTALDVQQHACKAHYGRQPVIMSKSTGTLTQYCADTRVWQYAGTSQPCNMRFSCPTPLQVTQSAQSLSLGLSSYSRLVISPVCLLCCFFGYWHCSICWCCCWNWDFCVSEIPGST